MRATKTSLLEATYPRRHVLVFLDPSRPLRTAEVLPVFRELSVYAVSLCENSRKGTRGGTVGARLTHPHAMTRQGFKDPNTQMEPALMWRATTSPRRCIGGLPDIYLLAQVGQEGWKILPCIGEERRPLAWVPLRRRSLPERRISPAQDAL